MKISWKKLLRVLNKIEKYFPESEGNEIILEWENDPEDGSLNLTIYIENDVNKININRSSLNKFDEEYWFDASIDFSSTPLCITLSWR